MLQLYYFCNLMKQEDFSQILSRLLADAATEHGKRYPQGGALAWGLTGASYLGFALCGLPQTRLRDIQYSTRDRFGYVILDCRWYDSLVQRCFAGRESIDVILPGADGTPCHATLTTALFLEMLDFCREG
jgi:hypothetical protein